MELVECLYVYVAIRVLILKIKPTFQENPNCQEKP